MVAVDVGTFWQQRRAPGAVPDLIACAYSSGLGLWAFAEAVPANDSIKTIADIIDGGDVYTDRKLNSVANAAGMAADASRFVVVCGAGELVESTDGITWNIFVTLAGTPALTGVAAGLLSTGPDVTTFVAVSNGGGVWYRNASNVWVQSDVAVEVWAAVANMPGTDDWVVAGLIGGSGRLMASSGSPTAWLAPYTLGGRPFTAIDASSSYFMVGGGNGIVFRSATGLSGSWTSKDLPFTTNITTIRWLGGAVWFAAGADRIYLTTDDGDNWTRVDPQIWSEDAFAGAVGLGQTAAAICGEDGRVWISFGHTQSDPPDPVTPPATEQSITENDDYAGDAIRRLVSQFRSGTP